MNLGLRLLVVSHTPHYATPEGPVGWGPTVREIDRLSELFEVILHVAPLHEGPPPATSLPYRSARVHLQPVPQSGGPGILDKLRALRSVPRYLVAIARGLRETDAVHVRCPAGIALLALALLAVKKRPKARWFKYAGNWQPGEREPWSYSLQRGWLARNFSQGAVTVNGRWPGQAAHVISFINPSLNGADLEEGRRLASGKRLVPPVVLLFVGRVESAKGAGRILDLAARLHDRGLACEVHLVGDGAERTLFEQDAASRRLGVVFHGWIPRAQLNTLYARAHFVVLPSTSEGWPKVLSEGMAYGAVPLAHAISSIPDILGDLGVGAALPPQDGSGFAELILTYAAAPGRWQRESQRSIDGAARFSYDRYLEDVRALFRSFWRLEL